MGRVIPRLDRTIKNELRKGTNPKELKTRRNIGFIYLPTLLEIAAQSKLNRISSTQFRRDVVELQNILHNLKIPDDKYTTKLKEADIKAELEVRDKLKFIPDHTSEVVIQEEIPVVDNQLRNLILGKLENRQRHWHYYEYDEWASNLYMAVRLPANYAVIKTVMDEVHSCDLEFQPRSVLDFGSGMGTTLWAVNEVWPNSVSEFMNIEISEEQRYLCEYLLRGGKDISHDPLPGVFHRRYLPASDKVKYDMVVAAYSMLELPNADIRAQTIENLWNKTNDLLVIIERGNAGGFAIINEARHFILDLGGHDVTKKVVFTAESRPIYKRHIPNSHVLAPCPHEFLCPRSQMLAKKGMNVCRFPVHYEPLNIGMSKPSNLTEEFSYVVLRKGPHPAYEKNTTGDKYYPGLRTRPSRIVEPRKKGTSHIIHRLCCPNGSLAECVYTKAKYGRASYEVAKSCRWGDLMPIKVDDNYKTFSERNKSKDES